MSCGTKLSLYGISSYDGRIHICQRIATEGHMQNIVKVSLFVYCAVLEAPRMLSMYQVEETVRFSRKLYRKIDVGLVSDSYKIVRSNNCLHDKSVLLEIFVGGHQ